MLDRIHDPFGSVVVLGKYYVAVLAHDLRDKAYTLNISHLIEVLCVNPYRSFKSGLGNAYDPSALNPLS